MKKFKTETDHYKLRVGRFGWSANLVGLVGFWLVAGSMARLMAGLGGWVDGWVGLGGGWVRT